MHIAFAPSSGQKVSRTIVSWGLSTLIEAQVGLSDNRGMLRLGRRAAGKVWTPQAEREGESMVLSGPMLEGPQQELQDGGSQSYAEGWESCGAGRVGQRTWSSLLPLPITLYFPLAWSTWYTSKSAKEPGWSSPEGPTSQSGGRTENSGNGWREEGQVGKNQHRW